MDCIPMRWNTIFQNGTASDRDVFSLTAALVIGIFLVVPLIAVASAQRGLSLTVGALGGLAVVGGAFGLLAVSMRRLLLSAIVATVVLSTVAANLPLVPGATSYPGNLGPQLMLVHVPLLLGLGLCLATGIYRQTKTSWIELTFAAFLGWTVLAAVFGAGPRMDTALYFTAFMATAGLAMSLLYRVTAANIISLTQAAGAYLVAIAGHCLFALAQLLHQHTFGLTILGEIGRNSDYNTMAIGPIEFSIGIFISGLSGGNGPLSVLLVLGIPLAAGLAISERGVPRYALVALTVLQVFILRITGKDSGRGAFALTLLTFFVLLAGRWYFTGGAVDRSIFERYRARLTSYASIAVVLLAITFLPSKATTNTWSQSVLLPSVQNMEFLRTPSISIPLPTATLLAPVAVPDFDPSTVTLPFFSTRSLGIRLQQYLAGLHITSQHPIFGLGGANYPYVAPKYGLPKYIGEGGLFPLHSTPIALLAETGIPGAAFYFAAIGVAVWSAVKLLSTNRPIFVVSVLSMFVGWAVIASLVVTVRYTMVVPIWVVAGAVVGAARARTITTPVSADG